MTHSVEKKRRRRKPAPILTPDRLTLRYRLLSGLLVLVPAGITVFVLSFVLNMTVGVVAKFFRLFLKEEPKSVVLVLSSITLFMVLYAVGTLASHVVGRKVIDFGERLLIRIPFVKAVYVSSKQVIELFQSRTNIQQRKVALVDFPIEGLRVFGFVTGETTDPEGRPCYTVFIPTTPNPTSGYLELVPFEKTHILDMAPEEAVKLIMTGGFLGPDKLQYAQDQPAVHKPRKPTTRKTAPRKRTTRKKTTQQE